MSVSTRARLVVASSTMGIATATATATATQSLSSIELDSTDAVDARTIALTPLRRGDVTWLTASATGVLYATSTEGGGAVQAWRPADDGTMRRLGEDVPTATTFPCHAMVHSSGRFLLVSDFHDGAVVVVALGGDGAPRATSGLLPLADRADAGPSLSHAHMVGELSPGLLAVTDLGANQIALLSFDVRTGAIAERTRAVLPGGCGPRHFARVGSYLYVTAELSNQLIVLELRDSSAVVVAAVDLGSPRDAAAFPSGLVVTDDGLHAFVLVRGADRVVIVRLAGRQSRVATQIDAQGEYPWDAVLIGGRLLVANQRSNRIVAFDVADGPTAPRPLGTVVETPHPVALCRIGPSTL